MLCDANGYLKTSRDLKQYFRDEPGEAVNAATTASKPFKSKVKATEKCGNSNNTGIEVTLKYISDFCRTLEIALINWEINLILTWSANYNNTNLTGRGTFTTTDTKPYVLVVTLSTNDNVKLMQQLKSSFKRKIDLNRYQSKVAMQTRNQYLG